MVVKRIALLGATGSIGENTLRVLRGNRERLELTAIAGRRRWRELAAVAREFGVGRAVLHDAEAWREAREAGAFPPETELLCGDEGLRAAATGDDVDIVVAAAVGTVGLAPVLAAIEAGKDIALASKEILVLAGKFVMGAASRHGVRVLPVDSEHNAIFQCLQGNRRADVAKIILTASGGRFRDCTLEQMARVTPAEAVEHPNWDMGPKVTVDSSTMANKGLEIIEARWLFGVTPGQIDVTVHPQSIVHSMVEFVDGSILAQLSPPSMTFAIQHILLFPERFEGVHETLDFSQVLTLDFRPPDVERFPCLRLAREALREGGAAPAIFNAANEIAVAAFLAEQIPYPGIPKIIGETLAAIPAGDPADLEAVLAADSEARRKATEIARAI